MEFEPLPGLLSPISPESPAGEDLSFDPVMDEIREARRADDPTIAQGAWVQALKTADWAKVQQLCEGLLKERTKDLQVACWYAEAMVNREGFKGLAVSLKVIEGFLSQFWESVYPRLEDGGVELRIGRLEWLDSTVGLLVRKQPVTSPASGGLSWLKWKESRDVENLGLKDPAAKEAAIEEGKLTGDAFEKAVKTSGPAWFRKTHEELVASQAAYAALIATVDKQMGLDAPSLDALKESIEVCETLARNLRSRFESMPVPTAEEPMPETSFPSSSDETPEVSSGAPRAALASRAQAVARLREAAAYFKTYEPHSPVAPLAERAARWATMNLDTWLAEVVKDDSVLAQLRTLLDFQNEDRY